MMASINDHVNAVQYLVEAGGNLEAADEVSGDVVCDMVIDAGSVHSIDKGCHEWSCECGAMLGEGGCEARGSRQGEWSCGVGEC